MNVIRRLVRRFGFDVIRYVKKKEVRYNSNTELNRQVLIPPSVAEGSLKSVGRVKKSLFTYFDRPEKSSLQLDEIENNWWNAYGNLIESVWVLSDDINALYRQSYVSKASSFFKQEGGKAVILDLGCGSGWFGRMIADKDLEYHGTDFSSTQIAIANEKKANAPNKQYLNYFCTQNIAQVVDLHKVTGVVIHAFLHHLYWEELHKLFKDLVAILPSGCKFFIVEPIYSDPQVRDVAATANRELLNDFTRSYRGYIGRIKEELMAKGSYDLETEDNLNFVFEESRNNGFFFSPKEVPFRMTEFKNFLSNYLQVKSIFNCGVLNLETAQFLERIKTKEKRDYYCSLLFPYVNSLDKFLLCNGYYEQTDGYLFVAIECVLEK